jgi:outer membrane lipoprotein carrier protein
MKIRSLTRFFRTAGIAAVLFLLHATARGQSAEDILERMRQRYGGEQAIRAEFVQETTSPFSNRSQTSSGVIYLQGDNYRVETDQQTFVTDGVQTWIYDAGQNQVLINDYVEDETTFSLNALLFEAADRFDVTRVNPVTTDGALIYEVTAVPLDPSSFFREINFQLRDSDNIIPYIDILDVNDTRMTVRMEDVDFDLELPADTFSFEPPAEAQVIDLRS